MGLRVSRFIATAGGIGFFPYAPGTMAALFAAVSWFAICKIFPWFFSWQLIPFALIIAAGIYCSGRISNSDGKDPSHVVIDEVAGMLLTLIFIPPTIINFLAGFVLFRFFDIAKPLGIKRAERFKKGWGVMSDDLLAGTYSAIILQLLLLLKIW